MVELAIGRNLKLDSLDFQNSHLTSPDKVEQVSLVVLLRECYWIRFYIRFESDFESDSELKTFL